MLTFKEKWKLALHDPILWIATVGIIVATATVWWLMMLTLGIDVSK